MPLLHRQTLGIFSILLLTLLLPPAAAADPSGADASNHGARDFVLDTVTLDNGSILEYAEVGRGRGNVVVFLHGYTDSWFSFSTVLEHLPPGFHAYSISQRGHGDSFRPASGYEMGDFSDDVIAFLDYFGIRRAAVVGHSMGSVIAQRVAIDHPDRVSHLVLLGSGADMTTNAVLVDFLDFVQTLTDPIDADFVREFQVSTVFSSTPEGFIDTVVEESLKVPARVWRDALAGLVAADHGPELAKITAPTLILWGDKDEIFLRGDQDALVEGIPDAELRIYGDTGHGIHWERPERVAAALTAFLRGGLR